MLFLFRQTEKKTTLECLFTIAHKLKQVLPTIFCKDQWKIYFSTADRKVLVGYDVLWCSNKEKMNSKFLRYFGKTKIGHLRTFILKDFQVWSGFHETDEHVLTPVLNHVVYHM